MIPNAATLEAWCRSERMEVQIDSLVGCFLVNRRGVSLLELGFPRRSSASELQMYLDDSELDLEVGLAGVATGQMVTYTLGELGDLVAQTWCDQPGSMAETLQEPLPLGDPDGQWPGIS